MTLEVAQQVISHEIAEIEKTKKFDFLAINLFGGEPLLRFDMIKSFCQWLWELETDVKYTVTITSNGTLLTDDKKEWFKRHKDKVSLALSIDGENATQILNRGVTLEQIPIEFAHETWPHVHFLMTVSPETLTSYANDFISLSEKGYRLDGSHATGCVWTPEEVKIYEEQLKRIGAFFLEHPEYPPNPFFMHSFADQLANKCDYFCYLG